MTRRIRQGLGYDDVVDYNSAAYRYGGYTGTAINAGLMFANPCAMSAGFGTAARALSGLQGVGGLVNAGQNIYQGNYLSAAMDLAGAAGSFSQMARACFAAGTPLLTPYGSKPIEQFREGDELLSRSEHDPEGPVEVKRVEEVFVRVAPIIELQIAGVAIRTTAEHPFWVKDKGWRNAIELRPGDMLSTHDGQWIAIEEVEDTGAVETVYNLRVAEFHTYFVGSWEWGFSV